MMFVSTHDLLSDIWGTADSIPRLIASRLKLGWGLFRQKTHKVMGKQVMGLCVMSGLVQK